MRISVVFSVANVHLLLSPCIATITHKIRVRGGMGGRDANFAPSVWAIISVLNFHKLCFKKFITTHMQTNSKTTVFILCRVCSRYVFTPLNLQKAFVKSVITFNIFLDPTSFCIHINLNIYIDIRVRV